MHTEQVIIAKINPEKLIRMREGVYCIHPIHFPSYYTAAYQINKYVDMKYWSEFKLLNNSTLKFPQRKKINYDIAYKTIGCSKTNTAKTSTVILIAYWSPLTSFSVQSITDARWRQLRLCERDSRPRCDKMSDRWMARTYDLYEGVHVISVTNWFIWLVSKKYCR